MSTIRSIAGGLLGAAGLACLVVGVIGAEGPAALRVDELDELTAPVGSYQNVSLTINNPGSVPVTIVGGQDGCLPSGCVQTGAWPRTIAAGKSLDVDIEVKPIRDGPFRIPVVLFTDSPLCPKVSIEVVGIGMTPTEPPFAETVTPH